MTSRRIGLFAAVFIGLAALVPSARAQDWPQWRGPDRTGAASGGPALIDAVPEAGLESLIAWESEPMPDVTFLGNRFGNLGFSSPIGADGRVYLSLNWKMPDDAPLALTWGPLNRLGCFDSPLPADLAQRIEAARLRPQRETLPVDETVAWAHQWAIDNLDYEQFLAFGIQVQDRLISGPDAVDLDVLAKVAALKGKPFDSEDALKEALLATGLDAARVSALVREMLGERKKALDVVFCFDLETGKTLWKREYPGTVYDYGTSSTPCLVDGRLYASGGSVIYCLDAATGAEIWQAPCPAKEVSSSPFVEEGVLVIQAGALCGLDASTGQLLWSRPEFEGTHASPAVWRHQGKAYAVQDRGLVDLRTGRLLWQVGNCGDSSPVVYGDMLISDLGKGNVGCYRLAPDEPTRLWTLKTKGLGFGKSTPIAHDGHLYACIAQKGPLVCVDLATGELKWESPGQDRVVMSGFNTGSPVLVDGRVVVDGGHYNGPTFLMMIPANPAAYEMQVRERLVKGNYRSSSPTIVDGRLLIRGTEALVCYDLRKRAGAAGTP